MALCRPPVAILLPLPTNYVGLPCTCTVAKYFKRQVIIIPNLSTCVNGVQKTELFHSQSSKHASRTVFVFSMFACSLWRVKAHTGIISSLGWPIWHASVGGKTCARPIPKSGQAAAAVDERSSCGYPRSVCIIKPR